MWTTTDLPDGTTVYTLEVGSVRLLIYLHSLLINGVDAGIYGSDKEALEQGIARLRQRL
jgi:hypothetical protein